MQTVDAVSKYERLLQHIPNGYAVFEPIHDQDGQLVDLRIIQVNPAFGTLTGLDIKTAPGRSIQQLVPGLDANGFARYQSVLNSGKTVRTERYVEPLGRWYDISISAFGENQFAVFFDDITIRKQAEESLQENKGWLDGQMEAFRLAMAGEPLIVSLQALVETVEISTKGEARAGFYHKPLDKEGLHLLAGMTPEYADDLAGFKIGLDSLACGLCIVKGEPVITLDVETEPLWQPHLHLARNHDFRGCWSFPVRSEGGPILGTFAMYFRVPRKPTQRELDLAEVMARSAAIIISRDTEQRERNQAENALRESDGELRKLLQVREDFISIASHELKTPVTSIRLLAKFLETRWPASGDTNVDGVMIRKLNGQLDRLTQLINDLLDTGKMEEGRMRYNISEVSLNQLIGERVEEIQETRPERKIELKLGAPVSLTIDRDRISQVLVNVLSNALKYSETGTTVTVDTEINANDVIIAVTDRGMGIEPGSLDKIFERFYRAPGKVDHTYPGMGLGLYISAEIIKNHQGRMWAESEPGKGSIFFISLPLRVVG
jgi:two-component system CheB/CheR fusion protein